MATGCPYDGDIVSPSSVSARWLGTRRRRWIAVAGWLVAAAIGGAYQGPLNEEVTTDNRLFLPDDVEATQARELVEKRFAGGDTTAALVVYHRAGGLTGTDRARIAADGERLGQLEGVRDATPAAEPDGISSDGTTALTTVVLPQGDSREIRERVEVIRASAGDAGGLEVAVTGAPAVTADAVEEFSSVDLPLLLATAGLVLVILLLIYRSWLLAFVPLTVVAVAYAVAVGLVYALLQLGLTVDGQSAALLIVLMFGAGTDYCLLLLSRFREEAAGGGSQAAAMSRALRKAGPTIVASGLTVIAGLLTLMLASLGSMRALGPVCAIGILVMLAASVTLLPAALVLVGARRLRVHRTSGRRHRAEVIRRVARCVVARPRLAVIASAAALGLGALGLLTAEADTNLLAGFRSPTESARGFELLQDGFSAGRLAPVSIVAGGTPAAAMAPLREAVARADGVADVGPVVEARDGAGGRFDAVLNDDPYSDAGLQTVERLRAAVPADVLIGGTSAVQRDLRESARGDLLRIAPIALLVIGAILLVLLRAVPVTLAALASVVLSFAAALGISLILLRGLFGLNGIEPTVPLFAFVFLVALGVDYTIFLLARVREEAEHHGAVVGVARGLASTGGVITSAGVILAGTFAVLASFPLDAMLQLGFVVSLGVLIDTFVVRTLLLPGILVLLGRQAWWPRPPIQQSPAAT